MPYCHICVNSFYLVAFYKKSNPIHNFLQHFCCMLQQLKRRWNVNGWQLTLILCTFALGGSCCGYIGRKLMGLTGIDKGALWILLYIVVLTIIWPLCVLAVSIPFGQFRFFKNYLVKVCTRMSGKKSTVTRIAIFASGTGSNAQKLIDYFRQSDTVKVALIVCNKPGAGVLQIAENEKIPSLLINRERFFKEDAYVAELQQYGIDFVVLAGFLWKIPPALVQAYPNKMVNIHPALLPKYGGKGMYGQHVHEAVIAAGETESGITIHYVDELYDHGKIIFQGKCRIEPGETAGSLAQKIHALEHEHYPRVVAELLQLQNRR
jgi:formyltetrahydrofolate-dependent phosphoribosylglycinamide formyltransferase